jgi:Family of unknown function (DUF6499)
MISNGSSVPGNSWIDATSYDYLRDVGRPGFLWEWLRRDPGYRVTAPTKSPPVDQASSGLSLLPPARQTLVDRWGLHFRGNGNRSCERGPIVPVS